MAEPSLPTLQLSDAERKQFESVIERFEQAWHSTGNPQLSDFLPAYGTLRKALLRELVVIDIEFRQRAGEKATVEEYLTQFPELKDSQAVVGSVGKLSAAQSNLRERTASRQTIAPVHAGRNFGPYELLAEIGRGGMGVVYRARDTRLNRVVALKMIRSGALADQAEQKRFQAEAEAAAHLDHACIVPIYEVGKQGTRHFMALAFVDGKSLWERVKETPLAPRAAAALMRSIAEAVHYAHQKGIIHRDIKPQNILLTADEQPRLTDFGLAKHHGIESSLTATGQVLGTPSYMPPEQATGDSASVSTLSDIYSLGATLYCLVTGRPPFQAATAVDTLRQVIEEEPVSPRVLNAAVDRDLETICLKCLQKEPHSRYADVQSLVDDLDRFLRGIPIAALPVGHWERLRRWGRRNPSIAGLTAALFVVLVSGTLVASYFAIDASHRAIAERIQTKKALEAAEAAKKAEREAETAAEVAKNAEKLAADRTVEAQAAQKQAEEEIRRVRERDYLTSMVLAQAKWEKNNVASFSHLLSMNIPEGDKPDMRNFEWFYWRNQMARGRIDVVAQKSPVLALAISADETTVASLQHDRSITIWDVATGLPRRRIGENYFNTPRNTPKSLSLSPDGRFVCALFVTQRPMPPKFQPSCALSVWDTTNGMQKFTLDEGNGERQVKFLSARFSVDGKQIITLASRVDDSANGGLDIGFLKVPDGRSARQIFLPKLNCHAFALHPRGTQFATAHVDGVRIWDWASGNEIRFIQGRNHSIFALVYAPSGTRLITGGWDRTVRLWDTTTGDELATLTGHTAEITAIAVPANNDAWFASASADQSIRIWSTNPPRLEATLRGHASEVSDVVLLPNDRVLSSGHVFPFLVAWQWKDCRSIDYLNGLFEFAPKNAAVRFGTSSDYSPQTKTHSTRVTVSHDDGTPDVVIEETGADKQNVRFLGKLNWSGERLAWPMTNQIVEYDTRTGSPLVSLPIESDLCRVAYGPHDELAACDFAGRISLWKELERKDAIQFKTKVESGNWPQIAIHPDGKTVLACSGEVTRHLLPSGEPIGKPILGRLFALSPDGDRVAVLRDMRLAAIHDLASGREEQLLAGHRDDIGNLVFAPDGQRLVTLSINEVRLWDTKTGVEVFNLDLGSFHLPPSVSLPYLGPPQRPSINQVNTNFSHLQFTDDHRLIVRKATVLDAERPPVAEIDAPKTAAVGEEVEFDGSTSRLASKAKMKYFWQLPDGTTSDQPRLRTRFSKSGDHEAILTVRGRVATDTRKHTVRVHPAETATEASAAQWTLFAEPKIGAEFSDDRADFVIGQNSLVAKIKPYHGALAKLLFPKSRDAGWSLNGKSRLVFWIKANTESPIGWQHTNPVVSLHESESKFVRLTPKRDLLETSNLVRQNNRWQFLEVPLSGDEIWTREGEIATLNWLTIGVDSWDHTPLQVQLDGLGLE